VERQPLMRLQVQDLVRKTQMSWMLNLKTDRPPKSDLVSSK
jgi:hypothetical protein